MVRHRLSPSGGPLDPAQGSGIPFLRRYVAAYNTVVYRPPAVLDLLEGPANEYPALFGFVVSKLGIYQAQLNAQIQLRWANPTGAPAAQTNAGQIALQVSEDGGATWISPKWVSGDAASGNGSHVVNRSVTATIFDDCISIKGDHIWQPSDVNIPLLARVAWTITETGFDVYSSYNDEDNPSGGWSFEGFLAEWQ
jgi:hypothetical protein